MNKILLVFFVVFSFLLTSCNEKTDAVRAYYENGNIKSELRYKDGKLNGECKWFYSNGKPEMMVHYDMNVLNGEAMRWYENGNEEARFYFKDNQYDSIFESYNVSGILVKKENYKDGVLNGLTYQWYSNGKPFLEGEYLDGMMHGAWIMYYENGSISSNAMYDKGTGTQRGYAPNGGYLMTFIKYKDNKKDGEEIHYDKYGNVTEIIVWDEGEYVGQKTINE